MTRILSLALAFTFSALTGLSAQPALAAGLEEQELIRPAEDTELSEFLWTHRPIVVFADTPADPRYQQQINMLRDGIAELEERDVIVLTDTDPKAASAVRKQLRPRGFMIAVIGKDGRVKMRKPRPWSIREISRSIDQFPTRIQEIEDRRGN
jgi:hypothetical protein